MTTFTTPQTRYAPIPVLEPSDEASRARLSPTALKAFFNLAERWSLSVEEARGLLGGLGASQYHLWKKDPARTLDFDTFTRVSLLVGQYKALHILFGDELADRWMKLPNTNPLFRGATPLEFALRGGIPALTTLRRLLDARRGGQ